MKIKILEPSDWYKHFVGSEFEVVYYEEISSTNLRFRVEDTGWVYNDHCVITELPESFCVKRCDDIEKWNKYVNWLNKTYRWAFNGLLRIYYGYLNECSSFSDDEPFGTEIHIDDMIKHIDYMERHIKGGEEFHKESQLTVKMNKKFDLTSDEGRLAYARKYYPIGTKYTPLNKNGELGTYSTTICESTSEPKWYVPFGDHIGIHCGVGFIYANGRWAEIIKEAGKEFDLTILEGRMDYARKYYPIGTKFIPLNTDGIPLDNIKKINYTPKYFGSYIEGGFGYIYANGKWAEIIKEETNMNTQKLSRQGLKEIHSVACSTWKITLEGWGSRNPLEDYIELSQKEIDMMFNASDNNQKSILSKYLKQDDDSVDVSDLDISLNKIIDVRKSGEYENNSFWISESYNWEIKKDSIGKLCLIPTKKK